MPETEKKQNRVLTIFTKEYKYEGLILLILSIIAVVLGALVLVGVTSEGAKGLVVNENVKLIGDYPLVFAILLLVLGTLSFLLAIWPFYKPSIYELKRVSWPHRGTLLKDSTTVFIFIIVLSLFFLLTDFAFTYLVQGFEWIAEKVFLL